MSLVGSENGGELKLEVTLLFLLPTLLIDESYYIVNKKIAGLDLRKSTI